MLPSVRRPVDTEMREIDEPKGEAAEALSQFSPATAVAMGRLAVRQQWRSGERVLGQDPATPVVMVLACGKLRLIARCPQGTEILSGWLLPGGVLGLMSAITASPWPIAAVAEGDCETLTIDASTLLEMARSDASIAMDIARILGQQALDVTTLSIARMEHTLTGRVYAVLRHFSSLIGRPAGAGARVVAVSQCDIASAVGASRARVNIELRSLERDGRIALGYRRVVVFDDTPRNIHRRSEG